MLHLRTEELVEALKPVFSDAGRVIVLHSNVFSFGYLRAPVEEIMEAIWKVILPDQTLLMPTFTLSFCRTGWYHSRETSSETGALTEHFRSLPGVRRTPCPIDSFAVLGPESESFVACGRSETCWGQDSVYRRMYDSDALVVGLGESLALRASIFHHAEELAGVPYRYFKTFSGQASFDGTVEDVAKKLFVRRLDVPVQYEYSRIISVLNDAGKFRRAELGMSFVEAFSAKDGINGALQILREDGLAVLSNRQVYEDEIGKKTFAFAGSSNLDLTAETFCDTYSQIVNHDCRLIRLPFGQYRQEILNPESALRVADPDYLLFLERAEDILEPFLVDPTRFHTESVSLEGEIQGVISTYVDSIRRARSALSGVFLVANFETLTRSPLGNIDGEVDFGHRRVLDLANTYLSDYLGEMNDTYLLDFRSIVKAHGAVRAFGNRYWYLGKIPFSKTFSVSLCREISGLTLAIEGKTTRLIVLDLDNTLWGGVIGEDGIEGIDLGGDYPGNVYRDFQLYLKALLQRGVALAICSKNTEEIALQAIRNHPEMILKETDFAEIRINWQDKGSNIVSICESISLGISSVLFLDDNPIEREWVRRAVPDCVVPELPDDISEWMEFLASIPHLQVAQITKEDIGRGNQLGRKRTMEAFKISFETVDAFLAELGMRIYIECYQDANSARVLQLLAKTNQFNTTTRRYTRSDLERLIEVDRAEVYVVGFEDRFFKKENVGVIILVPVEAEEAYRIDSFLMSCRVLGRRIETALMGWAASHAFSKGKKKLLAEFLPTEKNKPAEGLYTGHRFRPDSDQHFTLVLDSPDTLKIPAYFHLTEEKGVAWAEA